MKQHGQLLQILCWVPKKLNRIKKPGTKNTGLHLYKFVEQAKDDG